MLAYYSTTRPALSPIHTEDAMPITDYVVLTGVGNSPVDATADLRTRVLKEIRSGWQPLGGVSIVAERMNTGDLTVAACQAMGK